MQFIVARTSVPTGTLLRDLVTEELREANTKPKNAVICYGAPYTGTLPALNKNCSRYDKMEQGIRLRTELDENAVKIFTPQQIQRGLWPGVLLGRQRNHTRGRDIRLIMEPWQAVMPGIDFYTPYLDSVREFRVWIYRNRHLGTYQKTLTRPEQFTRIGRNYHNGWTFTLLQDTPTALKTLGKQALAALGLDFGAVDILERPDGGFVVLEVNSAPGVQDDRRQVIRALAHRVVRWMANGCPGRTAE